MILNPNKGMFYGPKPDSDLHLATQSAALTTLATSWSFSFSLKEVQILRPYHRPSELESEYKHDFQ